MATFSVTDIGTFKRCRRRWDWSSNARQNLTGAGSGAEPLELGGLIHRALADWIVIYTQGTKVEIEKVNLGQIFLVHVALRRQEIINAYEERTGLLLPESMLDSLLNVTKLGQAMMENYQEYHKTPVPAHMRFASPEQEIQVKVPGTEHACKVCYGTGLVPSESGILQKCEICSGEGIAYHYLSGTLDGLLQDEKDWFHILEHKTYDNRPQLIDLQMNDQFTAYPWMVRELNIGHVVGTAYDGMWKRADFGRYLQKEKRKSTIDDLFIRKIISKSNEELDAYGYHLTQVINEMANDPEIYPNVPWQGCSDCSFREPCIMQLHGDDPTNVIKLRYVPREVIRGGRR